MSNPATAEKDSALGTVPAAPWRIQAVSVLPNFRLAIRFRDGKTGIVDCSGLLHAQDLGIYAPLADSSFFDQVRISLGALTWPNGADLDPAWLHEMLEEGKAWSVLF